MANAYDGPRNNQQFHPRLGHYPGDGPDLVERFKWNYIVVCHRRYPTFPRLDREMPGFRPVRHFVRLLPFVKRNTHWHQTPQTLRLCMPLMRQTSSANLGISSIRLSLSHLHQQDCNLPLSLFWQLLFAFVTYSNLSSPFPALTLLD